MISITTVEFRYVAITTLVKSIYKCQYRATFFLHFLDF